MKRQRVSSGIGGLDIILTGGFLKAGIYIVEGAPGAGKTILANQVCFHHVAEGGCAAFVTLLAETHALMIDHMSSMSFFNEQALPERMYYVSALQALESDGLKGITALMRSEIRDRKVTMLVLDGLMSASETARSSREMKKFIHELQAFAAIYDCTVLLLTTGNPQSIQPEHTMVDGLIDLDTALFAMRMQRTLNVRKFRGGPVLGGKHEFRITDDGLRVFPRVEATFTAQPLQDDSPALSTGIEGLNRMMGCGGLPASSCTALVGPPGSGKTVMSLQFLELCSVEEPGLFFGFYESPTRLLANASSLGFHLSARVADGSLEFAWHPIAENILDQLGHALIEAVRARGVKRLVVDGLAGFFAAATEPERMERFLACLSNELRRLGATALYTFETRDVTGITSSPQFTAVSGLFDNELFVRTARMDPLPSRRLSILKMRGCAFDGTVRELRVGSSGVVVGGQPAGAQGAVSRVDDPRK